MSSDDEIWCAFHPDQNNPSNPDPRTAAPPCPTPVPSAAAAADGTPLQRSSQPSPVAQQDSTTSSSSLPADRDPVYVPAIPPTCAEELPFVLETHDIGGERCLLVFTDIDLLTEQLGQYQPFLVMWMAAAAETAVRGEAQRIHVDPALPAEFPRWTRAGLNRLVADVEHFRNTTGRGEQG